MIKKVKSFNDPLYFILIIPEILEERYWVFGLLEENYYKLTLSEPQWIRPSKKRCAIILDIENIEEFKNIVTKGGGLQRQMR